MHLASLSAAAAAMLLGALSAHADTLFEHPVQAQRLAHVRGGFSATEGSLAVAFGLQRAVLVDGVPVAQSADAAALLVVQRGPNNTFAVAAGNGVAGSVIQNSLDNQRLQVVTTLDVTTNSLQTFVGTALQSQLRSSLTDSIRR